MNLLLQIAVYLLQLAFFALLIILPGSLLVLSLYLAYDSKKKREDKDESL